MREPVASWHATMLQCEAQLAGCRKVQGAVSLRTYQSMAYNAAHFSATDVSIEGRR